MGGGHYGEKQQPQSEPWKALGHEMLSEFGPLEAEQLGFFFSSFHSCKNIAGEQCSGGPRCQALRVKSAKRGDGHAELAKASKGTREGVSGVCYTFSPAICQTS